MKLWNPHLPLSLVIALQVSQLSLPTLAKETLAPVELDLSESSEAEGEDILPEITVQSDKAPLDKGYQGRPTRVGKTLQSTKDIPQSVTIVSEELMEERNAFTLKDSLRNVAGLTINAGEGGGAIVGDNITLRGYSAIGDLYLDGLRDTAPYNRDTFNIEQVEVLRGAASMLYGRGATGGIINQVSKAAEREDYLGFGMTGGSYDFRRATVDVNKLLTDNLAFRLNAMGTSAESFRRGPEQRRWGIAPSLKWWMNDANELTLNYFYMDEDNIPDFGLPFFNGRPLNVSTRRFYGLANADYERTNTNISTLSYVHRFNEQSLLRSTVRYAYYDMDLRGTAPRLADDLVSINDGTTLIRRRQARGSQNHAITSQTEYNGRFETGPIGHEVLSGVEYIWNRGRRWTNASDIGNPDTTVGRPDSTPALPFGFYDAFARTGFHDFTGKTTGVYLQDTLQLLPHWKVMLGTRFDNLNADYNRPAPDGPLSRNDDMWSYRSGLLYQPTETSTYYASYGTSYNPTAELYQLDQRTITNVSALDTRTANTPPEKNRNIELGSKWDLLNGNLSLRTALFRTEKTDERNVDPLRLDSAILTGKRHTDGIELEAVGRITPNWQVMSALALMRSEVTRASGLQSDTLGNRPFNTPNYTYNVWSIYNFNFHGNWKIGCGVEGIGMRYADIQNTKSVPSFARVDAMIEYGFKDYAIRLNLFNLFNKAYFEGVYPQHVVPGMPRMFHITLTRKV